MKKEKLVVSSTGVDFKSVANLRVRKTRAEPKDKGGLSSASCLIYVGHSALLSWGFSSVGRATGC